MTPARPRPRFPLRAKIFLLVAVLALVAIGLTTATSTRLLRTDRLAYVNDVAALVAEKLATQTRGVVTALGARLRLFAGLCRGAEGEPLRERATRELLAGDPDLVRVRLLAPGEGGPVVLAAGVNPAAMARADLAEADLEGLDAAAPAPLTGDVPVVLNRSLPPATPLLTVVVPVGEGQVVVADWLPQELIRLYTRNPAYQAFLLAADGTLMVHPDATLVVQRKSLMGLEPARAVLSGTAGQRGTRSFTDPDGVRQIGAFASADVGGLAVVSYLPEQRALAASERLVRLAFLGAAGLLVLSLMAAWLFSRRITRPLERLSEGTARLAVGDYRVEVEAPGGDELGVLARDFTTMARQLEALHAQLVQSAKLALLGQLGAGLTHEVKNPLGAILGFTELMRDEAEDPSQVREYAGIVLSAAQRALGIITRVLVYARPGTEERSRVAPAAFIGEATALVRHQLQMARLKLVEEVPAGLPEVIANGGQIQQVLVNLLMNARDATPAGGHVTLSAAAEEGQLVIRVKDDGSGMPEEVRQRLFEPFFTTKPEGKGTGLGLSVSHSIVESHGGTIRVESAPGQGSTFEVRLPLAG